MRGRGAARVGIEVTEFRIQLMCPYGVHSVHGLPGLG